MHHPKRPRKQKIVWDSSDFIACIASDDQLLASNTNLAGMDKEEEHEMDVQKAATAQAVHQLHEIKTPQVEFSEAMQFNKNLLTKKSIQSVNALTKYDVLSNMYALDKDDEEFCKKEHINPFFLSWYFTNASRTNHDDFFAPSQLFFLGVATKTFKLLGQQYDRQVKKYNETYGYSNADLAPNIARFRHITNVPASYTCFFPRPPKIATRRKSQMESKVIEATFQIRQNVITLHATIAYIITNQLEDLRLAQTINEKVQKNDSDEPKAKRFKESLASIDDLSPKVKQLALVLQEYDKDLELEECPLVTDEFLDASRKQAAILKVRSLFPEFRSRGEQLSKIQQRIKEKDNKKYEFSHKSSSIPSTSDKVERIKPDDFKVFNQLENDDYIVPVVPYYKKQ